MWFPVVGIMDSHSLQVLEFDKVIEKVASFAVSPVGKEEVRRLEPVVLPKVVQNLQGETAEARDLIVLTSRFPLEGIHDLRPYLERGKVEGAMLDGMDLYRIAQTLQGAATLREFILKQEGKCPNLERLARLIVDLAYLGDAITAAIDEEGRVVDDASPELASIRRNMNRVEGKIRSVLSRMTQNADVVGLLQDNYVTMRDGRYVLPVLSHQKNEIEGIVHDRSDTGQTVFVEPRAVVELGNELRDLVAQERVEVRRILRELTAQVREEGEAIEGNLQILADADAIAARARFSLQYKLSVPQFGDERELNLIQGKHPLLLFGGVDAVPIDLGLDERHRILVISGPNAGGKTVALKTVGLLCLMAQAGLHVPASERSQFCVFQDVLADVGDEQSIEEALSSFSGHVARLKDILTRPAEGTLIVIDELGTATDPQEGGALACAVLDELYDSSAFAVVTTHLNDPKVMAHEYPAMENAAVQFDLETLRPTYQLTIGLPGSSHAFDVAARMGLPESIIEKARERLGEGAADLDALLTSIREQSQELQRELDQAEADREEAEGLKEKYDDSMAKVKRRKQDALKKANLEAERILADAQREAEAIVDEMKREAKLRGGKQVRSEVISSVRQRSRSQRDRLKKEADRLNADLPEQLDVNALERGMEVFVLSLSRAGRIVSVKRNQGRARVAVGATQFDLKVEDLAPVAREGRVVSDERPAFSKKRFVPQTPVEREVNLVGKRVEEAKAELDRYLEKAALSDHTYVRIVHGFGTGALRKAVQEALRSHPSVDTFRSGEQGEGGAGVTIARLTGGLE